MEVVRNIVDQTLTPAEVGVSETTARKGLGRLAEGELGLSDRSSRPTRSPRAIGPQKAMAIVELRPHQLTRERIAQALGVSKSTGGWTYHYNRHRPHLGIKGLAPIRRLADSYNALLTLHT